MTTMAAVPAPGGEVTDNSAGGKGEAWVVDNGPVQVSEQDDRLYRHITLSNQMQASLTKQALVSTASASDRHFLHHVTIIDILACLHCMAR